MKKTPVNELHVFFPSLSSNEGLSRAVTSAFMASLNPTLEELTDVKCAVSEAVTNAIVHGYAGTVGEIELSLRVYEGRQLSVTVKDHGCGIPDVEKAKEPLFTTDAAGERSGMGFSVMENFMDSLRVKSEVGKGTRITMTKRLSGIGGYGRK